MAAAGPTLRLAALCLLLPTLLPHPGAALNLHWCPELCDCYTSFTTADCSKQQLQSVPEFSNLTTRVYLDKNAIRSLRPHQFAGTPDLLELTLQENSITEVNTRSFCGLRKLAVLNLSSSKVATFTTSDGAVECQAPGLIELLLDHNDLRSLPANLSYFAPNLEILNLGHNQIQEIMMDPTYSFLHSLQNLDLSYNLISNVYENDLAPLGNISLEFLSLAECVLTRIEPGAFRHLPNLTSLTLSHGLLKPHNLEQIFTNSFTETSPLCKLDLKGILLNTVTTHMLGMFRNLTILDISHCEVATIEPSLFDRLNQLETLHLEKNSLTSIPNLRALHHLRHLHLQENRLREVDLSGLVNLEGVDLSYNNLCVIPNYWLSQSSPLHLVNASYNNISRVEAKAFDNIDMHSLDLSHNKLTELHNMGELKLKNLYLSHNHLFSMTPDAFWHLEPILEELDLSHNRFMTFPQLMFHEFMSLQRLQLAHNHLGPAFLTDSLGDLFQSLGHLQVLDLSHNAITVLPAEQMQQLHHLNTLSLDDNLVQDLADLSLNQLESLSMLTLSRNKLASVKPDMCTKLESLELVDLSLNPYDCTCGLLPYIRWLNATLVNVLHFQTPGAYSCEFPPRLEDVNLVSFHPPAEECHHPAMEVYTANDLTIIGLSLACVLVGLAIIAGIFFYSQICHQIKNLHYRWQIRYREVSGVEIATDPKV